MAGVPIHGFLVWRQQIEEQGANTGIVKPPRHVLVARAETAAAAAVRKENHTAGTLGQLDYTIKHCRP
jgi:hypothetical protein